MLSRIALALLTLTSAATLACGREQTPAAVRVQPTASAAGSATPSATTDATLAAWSAAACATVDGFRVAYQLTNDNADPRTLTLEQRKQRSERQFPSQIQAAEDAAAHMRATQPPTETAAVDRIMRAGYTDLATALRAQQSAVASATTTAEIDASNVPVREALQAVLRYELLLRGAGYCATPAQPAPSSPPAPAATPARGGGT